jgi:hypothetical protein
VFDYPTLGELAEHLVSQLPDSDPPSADAESPQAPATAESAAEPEAAAQGEAEPTPED